MMNKIKMCKEKQEIVFDGEISITNDIEECLKCNSVDIENGIAEIHSDCIWVRSVCGNCYFHWDIRYDLAKLYVPEQ